MCAPKIPIPPPPIPPPPAPAAPQSSALAIAKATGSKNIKGLDLLRIPIKPMSNVNMGGYSGVINV